MDLKLHGQVNPAWKPNKVEGLVLKHVERTFLPMLVRNWRVGDENCGALNWMEANKLT